MAPFYTNPPSHLSVIDNFVGAILATKVGWLEPAKFLVLLTTLLFSSLYTRDFPLAKFSPIYTMFIATLLAASLAWPSIYN